MRYRCLLHLRGLTLYSPFFLFLLLLSCLFTRTSSSVPVLVSLYLDTIQGPVQIESGRNKRDMGESLWSVLHRQPVIHPLPDCHLLLVLLLLARSPHCRATHGFRNRGNP
jgi:hypothetical protein